MTYDERLRKFQAALLKLALPAGVTSIEFNDGSDNDYQVFAALDFETLPTLRGVAVKLKNLLNTIDGVRCYASHSPVMSYEGYRDNEGKKLQAGYDQEYITINMHHYHPDEQ